jgi:hypothetical protein
VRVVRVWQRCARVRGRHPRPAGLVPCPRARRTWRARRSSAGARVSCPCGAPAPQAGSVRWRALGCTGEALPRTLWQMFAFHTQQCRASAHLRVQLKATSLVQGNLLGVYRALYHAIAFELNGRMWCNQCPLHDRAALNLDAGIQGVDGDVP